MFFFLFAGQKLQCVTSNSLEPSDSVYTESSQDRSVYILLLFPVVVIVILCVMLILFICRHDVFWYLCLRMVKIILRYCMYIEDNSDKSYSCSTESVLTAACLTQSAL